MINTVEVYKDNVKGNMLEYKDLDNIVGKYATTDMYANSIVLEEELTDISPSNYSYLDNLDGAHLAISIKINSLEDSVSDKLQEGDIVRIYANTDSGVVQPESLSYVEVLAMTSDEGYDEEELENTEEIQRMSTVTLRVIDEQARELVDLNQNGIIHLALVYRGDDENKENLLKQQDEINGVITSSEEPVANQEEAID